MITTRAARRFTASALATLGAAGLGRAPSTTQPAQPAQPAPQAPSLDVCEYLSRPDAVRACHHLNPHVPKRISHMACMRREIELRCKVAEARMGTLARKLQKGNHK